MCMMCCLDEHMYHVHGTHDGNGCAMCMPGSHRRSHWIPYNRLLMVMNHCVSARNHTVSSLRAGSILKTESSLQTSILQLMKKPRINLFFLWIILVNWKFSSIIAHNYISQLCYWLVVWLNFHSFLILNLLNFKMKFNHTQF